MGKLKKFWYKNLPTTWSCLISLIVSNSSISPKYILRKWREKCLTPSVLFFSAFLKVLKSAAVLYSYYLPVAFTRFYLGSLVDPSESYSIPRRVELMRHKEELKAEMSRIVAIFKINCSRRIQVLRQRHKKELLHLAKLKKQADSVVIRKGSVRRR